jgi:uncharacterized protein (DUF736 family)
MAYQQRPNSGSLFKNNRKEKDNHPDYNGEAEINGKPMYISAWIKKTQNGGTFMSLAFKPKETRQQFGEMHGAVDRNVSDVPTGGEPTEQEIPF